MELLYYIILRSEPSVSSPYFYEKKWQIAFLGFQFLLIFGIPLMLAKEIFSFEISKIIVLTLSVLLILLNYFYLFRKVKSQKIYDKYYGKYQFIERKPIRAYFIFHLAIPISIFVLAIIIVKLSR